MIKEIRGSVVHSDFVDFVGFEMGFHELVFRSSHIDQQPFQAGFRTRCFDFHQSKALKWRTSFEVHNMDLLIQLVMLVESGAYVDTFA